MKLALFINTTHKWATPHPSQEAMEGCADYARTSEYVDVEFPPLSDETVIRQQIDALDRSEQELRNQFQSKLDGIQNRRAELQALTYVPAGA